jgi:TolA-binding protein
MDCPAGNVCFRQDRFAISAALIISILLFIYIKNSDRISQHLALRKIQKKSTKQIITLEKNIADLKKKLDMLNTEDGKEFKQAKKEITADIVRKEKEREIYFRRLGDPTEEPRRTYPFTKDIYDNVQEYAAKTGVNIPTRGLATDFQPIGILTNTDTKQSPNILQLYGRAIWPGSYKWQYYTNSDNFQSVKVQIIHKGRECMNDLGCEELYTGDIVKIPAYNMHFRAELYRLDSPAYIPHTF